MASVGNTGIKEWGKLISWDDIQEVRLFYLAGQLVSGQYKTERTTGRFDAGQLNTVRECVSKQVSPERIVEVSVSPARLLASAIAVGAIMVTSFLVQGLDWLIAPAVAAAYICAVPSGMFVNDRLWRRVLLVLVAFVELMFFLAWAVRK